MGEISKKATAYHIVHQTRLIWAWWQVSWRATLVERKHILTMPQRMVSKGNSSSSSSAPCLWGHPALRMEVSLWIIHRWNLKNHKPLEPTLNQIWWIRSTRSVVGPMFNTKASPYTIPSSNQLWIGLMLVLYRSNCIAAIGLALTRWLRCGETDSSIEWPCNSAILTHLFAHHQEASVETGWVIKLQQHTQSLWLLLRCPWLGQVWWTGLKMLL